MGHIVLEPTVEINMTEEDSDDVPDLELFEPSVEINMDEKAEPEKNTTRIIAPAVSSGRSESSNICLVISEKFAKISTNQRP